MAGWLKQFFGTTDADRDGEHRAALVGAVVGLDIPVAVTAHQRWKQALQAHLDGVSGGALEIDAVCRDDRCDLGQWIHGSARARLGTFPGFTALMAHHRMFHHVAANVLTLDHAGKKGDARRMLANQFEIYSERVLEDLAQLQRLVLPAVATEPPR